MTAEGAATAEEDDPGQGETYRRREGVRHGRRAGIPYGAAAEVKVTQPKGGNSDAKPETTTGKSFKDGKKDKDTGTRKTDAHKGGGESSNRPLQRV